MFLLFSVGKEGRKRRKREGGRERKEPLRFLGNKMNPSSHYDDQDLKAREAL